MKKGLIGGIGLLAAIAMGTAPTMVPAQQNNQNQRHHNEAIDRQIMPIKRQELPELMPGGGNSHVNHSGMTPMEYGQWLQSTGRQKWLKAKRK